MRTFPILRLALVALIALTALPLAAGAQGTLSTQGFGYPGGQLSARSLGTGGALGEQDPLSATNPASILNFNGSILYFQIEPEYRTLRVGDQTDRATIARFPLTTAAVPIGEKFVLGLTVSNLLDRSFITESRRSQLVGGSTVTSTNTFSSNGAIGDVRLALGWAPQSWLRLGVAGHVITGDNALRSTERFDDSVTFASIVDTATVTFAGTAYSTGVELVAPNLFSVAVSYRRGGPLSLKRADTTLRKATVPDRGAVGVAFTGIKGTTIAARAAYDRWSNMQSLAPSQPIRNSWDYSIGADVAGPTLLGAQLQLRTGLRRRMLPFGIPLAPGSIGTIDDGSSGVKERSYSFGTGTVLARGRASVDITGIRATRSDASTAIGETAWTMSLGVSVRP